MSSRIPEKGAGARQQSKDHTDTPLKILVVEDDADVRAVTAYALQADGNLIHEAENGVAAQECCRRSLPDLIITDIMMPKLDGIGLITWFRNSFPDRHVPILVLTALGSVDEKVRGLDAGADDYITKPFHHRELKARVGALIRTRQLMEQLKRRTEELERAYARLESMQQELVDKERQLVAAQLGGAAAHNLGQPLTAILLQCRLLETALSATGLAGQNADSIALVDSIKQECRTVEEILDNLKSVDAARTEPYLSDESILKLKS